MNSVAHGGPPRLLRGKISFRGTPLTFHYMDADAIEVTTGSLDTPDQYPPTKNFGVESRLPWIDQLMPGRLPDAKTEDIATRTVVSHQHPDRDTPND